MEHALPARSPRNKKKKNPSPYKKTQALIHTQKKKKKQTKKGKKKKKKNPKTQTVFPDQNSDSLSLPIPRCTFKHTDRTCVFPSIKHKPALKRKPKKKTQTLKRKRHISRLKFQTHSDFPMKQREAMRIRRKKQRKRGDEIKRFQKTILQTQNLGRTVNREGMEWGLGREKNLPQSKGKERRVRLNHTLSVPLPDLDHQIAGIDIDNGTFFSLFCRFGYKTLLLIEFFC